MVIKSNQRDIIINILKNRSDQPVHIDWWSFLYGSPPLNCQAIEPPEPPIEPINLVVPEWLNSPLPLFII